MFSHISQNFNYNPMTYSISVIVFSLALWYLLTSFKNRYMHCNLIALVVVCLMILGCTLVPVGIMDIHHIRRIFVGYLLAIYFMQLDRTYADYFFNRGG